MVTFLLKTCLLKCSHKWLNINAEIWFPIIQEKDKNSFKWIINDIIYKMSTDDNFQFGLYLMKYIMYKWDGKQYFASEYLLFLKKYLGISWELSYT